MKKVVLSLLMLLFLSSPGLSTANATGNHLTPCSIKIDGVNQQMKGMILDGSTMVPLRAIFEKLGAKVEYNDSSKLVLATKGDIVIAYILGDSFAYANNRLISLKKTPIVKEGTTYVPLRFVTEAFGANVLWDGSTNTAIIRSPQNSSSTSIAQIRSGWIDPMYYVSKATGPLFGASTSQGYLKGAYINIYMDKEKNKVILTNISDIDINLSQWSLQILGTGKKSKTFTYPENVILPAGQNLITTFKENKSGDFYWNEESLLDEKSLNVVFLFSSLNDVIVRIEY